MSATFKPKSIKGASKSYLWIMADVDGEFKAVCIAAKDFAEMMSTGFLGNSAQRAREAFMKSKQSTIPNIILPYGK